MMAVDGLTELAVMLKKRENGSPLSMTTGIVINSPPEPRIRLNDVVILEKENLIFASNLIGGYSRKLKFKQPDWGITSAVNDGGLDAGGHDHVVNLVSEDTPVEWTDTLVKDDEVILMPVVDGQLYYVLDKAVRFK